MLILVELILARQGIILVKKYLLIYIHNCIQSSIMPAYIHWKNNRILKQSQLHDCKHCLSSQIAFILLQSPYYKDETYKRGLQSIFPAENVVYDPCDILK